MNVLLNKILSPYTLSFMTYNLKTPCWCWARCELQLETSCCGVSYWRDILSSRRICTASAGFPHWPWALSDSSHPRALMSCSLCNLLCLVRCSCWLGLWSSKCRAFYHYAFSNFKRIVFVLMNFSFGHKGERRKGLSILCTSVVFFAGKWLPCDVRIKHKA